MLRLCSALTASCLGSGLLAADTFVVDAAGGLGSDFLTIADAVASPLVSDGDVLEIRPGLYEPFQTDKVLSLVGLGDEPGDTEVDCCPLTTLIGGGTGITRIVNMRFDGALYLHDSIGTIYVTDCEIGRLTCEDVDDVRILRLGPPSTSSSVLLNRSSAEIVDSVMVGTVGTNFGGGGSPGLRVIDDSYARVALSTARGGRGGDASGSFGSEEGGPGGAGISVGRNDSFIPDQSELVLLGPESSLQGGNGGWGIEAPFDGPGGPGLQVGVDAVCRHSSQQLTGGFTPDGSTQTPAILGTGEIHRAQPADPSLRLVGELALGEAFALETHGEEGTTVGLWFGLAPLQLELPGFTGFLSTGVDVWLGAGVIGAEGTWTLDAVLPASLPTGLIGNVQGLGLFEIEEPLRFTNPVHLDVH